MLSIVNEIDPLIFRCVCFVCNTNHVFSTHKPTKTPTNRDRCQEKQKTHIHRSCASLFKRNLLTLTLIAPLSFNLNQMAPSSSLSFLSLSSPFPIPTRESGHLVHKANLSPSLQTCLSPFPFSSNQCLFASLEIRGERNSLAFYHIMIKLSLCY